MKIKLDDKHWLNSDNYCFWVTEEVEVKEGKNAGSIKEERCSGYHRKFSDIVESFINEEIRSSEADSCKELEKLIKKIFKEVKKWKVEVEMKK